MVLQELRGFTYATALDLNQAWATKQLDWILTRPESVPSTFHGASTPISDYRWILQVLLIYSKKTKMSELMRTLEKSKVDLLTKYQVTKASLSDHLDKLRWYSQGCEKQALNNAAKSKILCPQSGLSRIYPNERWN